MVTAEALLRHIEYRREYYLLNGNRLPKRNYNYSIDSIGERQREQSKDWNRTHPEWWRANNAKRQRELGFIPLNQPFVGSVGHHIDREHVVYIPEEVHRSIPHNVFTGKNMEAINALAMKWAA